MPVIANRNSKQPVTERATTPFSAIRNHKVRKTCHQESSSGHGARYPSLRLQKRDFRFQGLLWNFTSYRTWCPCQEKPCEKRNPRPADNRIQAMMRSHSQALANDQHVCRALVLRICMPRRSYVIACLGKFASLSLISLPKETVES